MQCKTVISVSLVHYTFIFLLLLYNHIYVCNGFLLLCVETEIGTKDIVEQPVKPKKKRRTKKVKVPFQKDAQVASTSSHNVEPPQVIEDPLDKLVKKIVEEAS